jgi:hypothetical protein
MKKILKWAFTFFGIALVSQVSAQIVTSSIPLQRLNAGVLQTASTNIPIGSTVAFPWTAIINNVNIVTNPVTFTVSNLPAYSSDFVWTAKGDIASQNSPLNLDVRANTLSFAVGNVNRANRNIGASLQSVNDRGQSKGMITFSYTYPPQNLATGDTCVKVARIRASFTIDLVKQFVYTTVPAATGNTSVSLITGPACLQPLTNYTYSVEATMQDNPFVGIGIDQYNWDFSEITGATFQYSSTDYSSITIRTGTTVPASANLYCYHGQSNTPTARGQAPNNRTNCAFSSVRLQSGIANPVVRMTSNNLTFIPSPVTLSTTGSNCLAFVTQPNTTTNVTFSVTQVSGLQYDWDFGQSGNSANFWNTNPATSGPSLPYKIVNATSITISNINNNPGTIILTVRGGCGGNQTFTYNINRIPPTQVSGLISLNNCTNQGVFTTAGFATGSGVANLNSFSWTPVTVAPAPNWVFTGGGTILRPGAIPPATPQTTPGAYILNLSFGGGCTAVPYKINIRPAAVTLTSPSGLCTSVPSATNLTFAPAVTSGYTYSVTGLNNSVSPASGGNTTTLNRLSGAANGNLTATYTVPASSPACSAPAAVFSIGAVVQPTSVTTPTACIGSGLPGITAEVNIGNAQNYGTYTITRTGGANSILRDPTNNATINSVSGLVPTGNILNVPISRTEVTATLGNYTISHNVPGCTSSTTAITLMRNDGFNPNAPTTPVNQQVINLNPLNLSSNGILAIQPPAIATPTSFQTVWNTPISTNAGWYFTRNCVLGTPTSATENILLTAGGINPQNTTWSLNTATGATINYGVQGTVQFTGGTCQYRQCRPLAGWAQSPGVGNNQSEKALSARKSLPTQIGSIYPNPNKGEFKVVFNQKRETGEAKLILLDASGREVRKIEVNSKEVSFRENLPTGNYNLLIQVGDKVYSEKIIITD